MYQPMGNEFNSLFHWGLPRVMNLLSYFTGADSKERKRLGERKRCSKNIGTTDRKLEAVIPSLVIRADSTTQKERLPPLAIKS